MKILISRFTNIDNAYAPTWRHMRLLIFSITLFWVTMPQAKAVIMPMYMVNNDSIQNSSRIGKEKVYVFKKKTDTTSRSKVAKVFAFIFLGLSVMIPIVGFQSRLVIAFAALIIGLVALLLQLAGVATAKDEDAKKAAKKSLLTVFGIVVGVIVIALIVITKIGT